MKYTVKLIGDDRKEEYYVDKGTRLLDFLMSINIEIDSPCGGNGTCGKCRVRVEGTVDKPSDKEIALLGENAVQNGYRLACYLKVESDLVVYIDVLNQDAVVMSSGRKRKVPLKPIVGKVHVKLDEPSIHDQRADLERISFDGKEICDGSIKVSDKIEEMHVPLGMLQNMEYIIRKENFSITRVNFLDRLIQVESGNTTGRLYGIAVDIGTTTVAGYLIDMTSGKTVDVYSALNPQKTFGADVVSRINYTMKSVSALDELNKKIISCINEMVEYFSNRNGIKKDEIYAAVFAGNTTMLHFLMKLPPCNIAVSPFIPVTTNMHVFSSDELGIDINPYGRAVIFPSVSGYVGGDTVAAVLASGMYESDKISLLVDLGTNGEIVLGCRDWLYSCSTAAGPAFEGANIRNGIAGVKGAIDKVAFKPEFKYSTILGGKAIGICGSGIVDAVAGMLDAGIIDETGRIQGEDEIDSEIANDYSQRLVEIDGQPALLILPREECECDNDIAITQKDIREVQNAKAAIAAGIKVLIREAGIKADDIEKIYLAGGFGSYINVDSAVRIGLLPQELHDRIESIGNAAGAGACEALVCRDMLEKACWISRNIKYIELSARRDFMDDYIECMLFE